MTRYLDIMPQQSPTLPRNCNIMRASVVHTRKYHARELKLKNSPTPQAIREILLVRNCSWLIHLITVLFFFSLFMPLPLPAFCEMRLCYKYYKFDARNRFIGSLFTDFQYECFFAAIKGRVTIATSLTFSTNGKMFRISSETSFRQRAKFSSSA